MNWKGGEANMNLNGKWMLGLDRDNSGREKRWFETGIFPEAKEVQAPCNIQQYFPGYCGVAWYSREFSADASHNKNSRYMLHFGAVDYLADVWVNGVYVGGHEGGETPFVIDITDAIKLNQDNLLVVRVLNPGNEPIDCIKLQETPHRNKAVPYVTGSSYNHGGIVQNVSLYDVPAVYIADVFASADIRSGRIKIQVSFKNNIGSSVNGRLNISVAPANIGKSIKYITTDCTLPADDSIKEYWIDIQNPNLWSLDDPYLYRISVSLWTDAGIDEQSVRIGFREFAFSDGYFRLNGKRIFLRSAHTGNHYPIGMQLPHDLELLRRDLYYAKTMGFNMVRFIAGVAWESQLDFCDELGLLVYEESYAGWCLTDSPKMAERFDRSTSEMIIRDRNHPSVTIWGLLNETNDGAVFRHAVDSLGLVRSLDETRMVLLNSGRWDGKWSIGSISNPDSDKWEHLLGAEAPDGANVGSVAGGYFENAGDAHYYPGIPLIADSIKFFRKLGENTKPVFLSEHGNGGQVDAVRVVRLYEQATDKPDLEDYLQYKSEADKFLADWERFGMDSVFADPSDFMQESQRLHAEQRLVGLNAIRSNPNFCGYSITGLVDQGMTAEGLWTTFRELKPTMMEKIKDGFSPLRWCLFVEPVHGYRGQTFKLEALLANEDILRPGEYPARIKVISPDGIIFDKAVKVNITKDDKLVIPVLCDDIMIDGVAGRYEVVAYFEHGAAPVGGRTHFFVSDQRLLPAIEETITIWESDGTLEKWFNDKGIKYRFFEGTPTESREVILIGKIDETKANLDNFQELARRMYQGSVAIFLTPSVFKREDKPLGWLPLKTKGEYRWTQGWAAGRDDFAKAHPVFDGMPCNGLMDLTYYRDIIPGNSFDGQETPTELIAGAFAVGSYQPNGYYAGMHIGSYEFGAGSFMLNTLLILDNLGKHPSADRLVINLIRYASSKIYKPIAELPNDLEAKFNDINY
jgi:hypothetical protein